MIALVTGGASSGKSAYAEELACRLGGKLVYLAAMKPFGEEGAARVRKHRAQRAGKGFTTLECYEGLSLVLDDERLAGSTALLECLGNVVANALFAEEGVEHADVARTQLSDDLNGLFTRCAHVVVVGNEVGADGVAYPAETHAYQELVGSASCEIAERADVVVEVISGIPNVLKGVVAWQD